METNIQLFNYETWSLTKDSTDGQIKAYFQKVLELKQSGEEFPVDLDEVWPLVYGRKSDAVEALKIDFMKNVDYQVLRQNPQNLFGGRPSDSYKLTVSCMEFFIARKVRPVFEVYRQIFHRVAEQNILSNAYEPPELIMARALQVAQATIERHQLQLSYAENTIKEQAPKVEYYDKCLESKGFLTVNMIAAELGISSIKLNKLLCEWGVQYLQSGCYFLYAAYRERGFTVHRPHPYINSLGMTVTTQHMYWTESGKKFIIELYAKKKAA